MVQKVRNVHELDPGATAPVSFPPGEDMMGVPEDTTCLTRVVGFQNWTVIPLGCAEIQKGAGAQTEPLHSPERQSEFWVHVVLDAPGMMHWLSAPQICPGGQFVVESHVLPAGVVTVRFTVATLLTEGEVPVTVRVQFPTVAVLPTLTFRLLVCPAVKEMGLKLQVTPEHEVLAVSDTVSPVPESTVDPILMFPLAP